MFRKLFMLIMYLVLPRRKEKVTPKAVPEKGSVVYRDPVSYIAELSQAKNKDTAVTQAIAALFNTLDTFNSVRLSFSYNSENDTFVGTTYIKNNVKDVFQRLVVNGPSFTIDKEWLFLLIDEYSSAMDQRNFVTVNNSIEVLKVVIDSALLSLPSSINKLKKVDSVEVFNLSYLDFVVTREVKGNVIKFAFGYSSSSVLPVSSIFTVNYTNLATKRALAVK